ncbi:MAG TPA: helix-turn-helix transcriptional regulator [Gammaproteobacteria bacterium]
MPIVVNVDVMLARRKMRLNELAERVGITPQNLSVLKTGRARAIRFSTLEKLCEVLDCQPGDLFAYEPSTASEPGGATSDTAGPESDDDASSSADALTGPPPHGSIRAR